MWVSALTTIFQLLPNMPWWLLPVLLLPFLTICIVTCIGIYRGVRSLYEAVFFWIMVPERVATWVVRHTMQRSKLKRKRQKQKQSEQQINNLIVMGIDMLYGAWFSYVLYCVGVIADVSVLLLFPISTLLLLKAIRDSWPVEEMKKFFLRALDEDNSEVALTGGIPVNLRTSPLPLESLVTIYSPRQSADMAVKLMSVNRPDRSKRIFQFLKKANQQLFFEKSLEQSLENRRKTKKSKIEEQLLLQFVVSQKY